MDLLGTNKHTSIRYEAEFIIMTQGYDEKVPLYKFTVQWEQLENIFDI